MNKKGIELAWSKIIGYLIIILVFIVIVVLFLIWRNTGMGLIEYFGSIFK